MPAVCGGLPLTAPGLAVLFPARRRGYILQSCPFPMNGKGRGDRLNYLLNIGGVIMKRSLLISPLRGAVILRWIWSRRRITAAWSMMRAISICPMLLSPLFLMTCA